MDSAPDCLPKGKEDFFMSDSSATPSLAALRESLTPRLDFDDFLATLNARDRAAAEKRVAAQDSYPRPQLDRHWRRLACTLMQLAGHSVKLVGRQSVQFYIADGKYRMQVFALEDLNDGSLTVYCPDVLEEALAMKLLGRSHAVEPPFYGAGVDELLRIEPFNGTVIDPAAHFKDMVGWNRKAIRIALPESASTAQLDATEILCALAARHFVRPAPAQTG
jgi:hypothetical protein